MSYATQRAMERGICQRAMGGMMSSCYRGGGNESRSYGYRLCYWLYPPRKSIRGVWGICFPGNFFVFRSLSLARAGGETTGGQIRRGKGGILGHLFSGG